MQRTDRALVRRVFQRHPEETIARLIAWANKQFYDAVVKLYATEDIAIAQFYEQNYTFLNVIAQSDVFRIIIPMVTPDAWRKMDKNTKDILIGAYDIAKLDRNQE
jgi:hypothetical protein